MLRRFASMARAVDLRDLLALAGLAATAYGAGVIFAPAGFIVAGIGLWYLGVWHGAVSSPKIVVPAPETVVTSSERR